MKTKDEREREVLCSYAQCFGNFPEVLEHMEVVSGLWDNPEDKMMSSTALAFDAGRRSLYLEVKRCVLMGQEILKEEVALGGTNDD